MAGSNVSLEVNANAKIGLHPSVGHQHRNICVRQYIRSSASKDVFAHA
jgi:hypothetical protein